MNIKAMREKAGISQVELANKLNIGQPAVANWETGVALPRADKLPMLAKILNCTIDELLRKEG